MSEKQYKFTKQDCIGCREYCELQQQNEELENELNKRGINSGYMDKKSR